LAEPTHTGGHVWKLGTGQGSSVLEMVRAFKAANGKSVPYRVPCEQPGSTRWRIRDVGASKGSQIGVSTHWRRHLSQQRRHSFSAKLTLLWMVESGIIRYC
jgi:UDP-glucose 4-epimerase